MTKNIIGIIVFLMVCGCEDEMSSHLSDPENGDADFASDTDTDTDMDSDSGTDTNIDMDAVIGMPNYPDAGTDADTDTDTDTDSDTDIDTDADNDSGMDFTPVYTGWSAEGGSGAHASVSPISFSERMVKNSVKLGKSIWYAPLVDVDGNIYLAVDVDKSEDVSIVSYTSSGDFRWSYKYPAYYGFPREPVIDGAGNLYVSGALISTVHQISTLTGENVWSYESEIIGVVEEMVPLPSGVVIRGVGSVEAIDADGNQAWANEALGMNPHLMTTDDDGNLYLATSQDVYLKITNGEVAWGATSIKAVARAAVKDGRLYLPIKVEANPGLNSITYAIRCLDADDGAVIWTSPSFTISATAPAPSGVAVTGNLVYYGVKNKVVLLSKASGMAIDEYEFGTEDGYDFSAPIVDIFGRIVLARGNTLYKRYANSWGIVMTPAVDISDNTTSDGVIPTPPAIGKNGEIIVGSKSGTLYIFR